MPKAHRHSITLTSRVERKLNDYRKTQPVIPSLTQAINEVIDKALGEK